MQLEPSLLLRTLALLLGTKFAHFYAELLLKIKTIEKHIFEIVYNVEGITENVYKFHTLIL